jgi:hypothetical protein
MKGTARSSMLTAGRREPGVTLFVSYSHQDRVWMERLQPLLDGMRYDDRQETIVELDRVSCWHDNLLEAGDRWDKEIRDALNSMSIFVPLITHRFFASEYVMTVELEVAKKRHRRGEIEVVPILLTDINLKDRCTFLGQFNPLPAWGKCWSSYGRLDMAISPIDDGLWQAIRKAALRQKGGAET